MSRESPVVVKDYSPKENSVVKLSGGIHRPECVDELESKLVQSLGKSV